MGLYPPLEIGDNHPLLHVAEVKFRLEQDFRATLYKKYQRRANIIDRLDIMLSVASMGLAASGVGLLSTIITVPIAIGTQAGAIVCWLLGAGGKFIGWKLQAKARKHDQIRVLAETKLNTIADRISAALTNDKISDEEFRLILSEVRKFKQTKAEIRGRQRQVSSSDEKKSC